MAYHPRLSMEEPLKTNQKINKLHIPNSSYLKSFKKSVGNSFVGKSKIDSSQTSFGNDENSRTPKLREKCQISQKSRNQFQQLQYMMQETDNSMEELLNSSINQFEKLIIHQQTGESLEQQNHRLKNALAKMKIILKDKLETALQKQKDDLSGVLQEYIDLITKLLQDKQQLTIRLQQMMEEKHRNMKQLQNEYNMKLKQVAEERDEQIGSTKNQIEEFFNIIEQYEEEAKKQQNKTNQMQQRIQELEEEKEGLMKQIEKYEGGHIGESDESKLSARIQAQSTKIQTLLEVLEKTQAENNELKTQINQLKAKDSSRNGIAEIKQIKQACEKRIQELEEQHEEEFLEYQKAIRDTLAKKDECIERLNLIIEGLRQRKSTH